MRIAVLALVAALATACSSAGKEPPPSPPTPSAAAIDDAARQMCAELLKAGLLDATGNPTPAPGWGGSADQIDAYTARIKAQDYAIKSKVPAVRQLAAESPIDLDKLKRWCTDNGL